MNACKAYKYHLYLQASAKQQPPFAELLLREQPKQKRLQSLQYPKKSVATQEAKAPYPKGLCRSVDALSIPFLTEIAQSAHGLPRSS